MRLDFTDPDFLRDPGPKLGAIEAAGPVMAGRLPILGKVWFVASDPLVRQVLKSPDTFVRDSANAGGRSMERLFWWLPPFVRPLLRNPSQMDGADHARLRGLVSEAFNRSRIEDLRPAIAELCDDLLNHVDSAGPVDVAARYARPLPLSAICLLLGLSDSDRARVAPHAGALGQITGIGSFFRALPALWRLTRFFRAEIARVRRDGGDGLIARMIAVEADGTRLTDDDILGMSVALFIAGHETTAMLIGGSIVHLLTHPDQAAALRRDPSGWPLFVEEAMRWQSPVYLTNMLFVARPVDLGGVRLDRGDRVVPLLISANRSAERFPEPWAFDPARRPNAHLGFGHGPHVCLGMQLARLETQVALERFVDRFPDAQLDGAPDALPLVRRIGLRGFAQVPVRPRG